MNSTARFKELYPEVAQYPAYPNQYWSKDRKWRVKTHKPTLTPPSYRAWRSWTRSKSPPRLARKWTSQWYTVLRSVTKQYQWKGLWLVATTTYYPNLASVWCRPWTHRIWSNCIKFSWIRENERSRRRKREICKVYWNMEGLMASQANGQLQIINYQWLKVSSSSRLIMNWCKVISIG